MASPDLMPFRSAGAAAFALLLGLAAFPARAAAGSALGEQRLAALLVRFQNEPAEPYSVGSARRLIYDETGRFIRQASYGRAWLTGEAFGWLTLPGDPTCDARRIADLADRAAADAGIGLSAYPRRLYLYPGKGCGGRGEASYEDDSRIWARGILHYNVIAHELGHAFGLPHAHSLDCGTRSYADDGSCVQDEYGDIHDVMGGGHGDFNAWSKERLGWLEVPEVSSGGVYALSPLQQHAAGGKGLKIPSRCGGAACAFYLERRLPADFDGEETDPRFGSGVLIRRVLRPGDEHPSADLLDATPGDGTFLRGEDGVRPGDSGVLGLGETFEGPGFSVTPQAVQSGKLSILIRLSHAP